MKSLYKGRELETVGGVILRAGQTESGTQKVYYAGDVSGASGYVFECENEAGSQETADAIFAGLRMRGFRYQPFEAGSAYLDPSSEVGDWVTVDGTVSIIHSMNTRHGRLMASDISAPLDEEVNHEFPFETKTQREFRRESALTRARLTIAEGSIEAKVDKTGDDGTTESFSWKLLSNSHTWYSNDTMVMRVDRRGLRIEGEVYATSGRIGDAEIVNGVLTVNGANIRNLNADYITVGTLNVARLANESITGGSGGKIANSTLTTFNTNSGINTNLGYAANYGLASSPSGAGTASVFRVSELNVAFLRATNEFRMLGRYVGWKWSNTLGGYYLGELTSGG